MTEQQRIGIATPKKTKELLKRHGLTFKKSLGQNFLIDTNILERIVGAANLTNDLTVLEIGPGIGALTERLAMQAERVIAVEIDQRLIPVLEEQFSSFNHVTIIHDDILKTDLTKLIQQERITGKVSVVANLPYYITTPIIMKLLESKLQLENIVVMMQKEVADRIHAKLGSKEYGSLSIAVQYYCETELVFIVPRTVFIPQPNIDSAVLNLKVRETPAVTVSDEPFFFEVIRASFAQRRKTLLNNLQQKYTEKGEKNLLREWIAACDIDPGRRAETLSIQEFAKLANYLAEKRLN